ETGQFSNITVQNGGTLEVQNGGTLRLERGGKIVVEEGGTLIIQNGADIDLWWNDFWYQGETLEGSSIHIQADGELVINGNFNFSGSGFFQFDNGNILTLNAPFVLEGTGKGNRFARLNNGATLNVSSGQLDWSYGKVEYLANSEIKVESNGEVVLDKMVLEGFDPSRINTAIWAEDAAKVDVLFSDFLRLETGIDAFGMADNNDVFRINNCVFSACNVGVSGEYIGFMNIIGTNFTPYDKTSIALQVQHVASVKMVGGNVSGYEIPLGAVRISHSGSIPDVNFSQITDFNINNTDIINNTYGVVVEDSSRANIVVTSNALIDNNTKGIYASEAAFANVTVNKGATISNNGTGIHIGKWHVFTGSQGNFDFGIVEMACAKLINNNTGVQGKDLLLNIDACINSGQTAIDCDYTQTNPNHFENPAGGTLFDICYFNYTASDPPPPIDATGNYWGPNNADQPSANNFMNISIGLFSGNICAGTPFNDANPATDLTAHCGSGDLVIYYPQGNGKKDDCLTGGGVVNCLYGNDATGYLVMNETYRSAFESYKDENTTQSASEFSGLANISEADKDNYCAPCQHYIKVARGRTFYNAGTDGQQLVAKQSNEVISNQMTEKSKNSTLESKVKLFPNPTNGILNVHAGMEQVEVRVLDLHGRVQYRNQEGYDFQINTRGWAAGVYIVELSNDRTNEIIQKRIIVQPE
ncbi:MAG: T9SS type A sorting domain-containing protein, partial [Bacteroidota bacterium]